MRISDFPEMRARWESEAKQFEALRLDSQAALLRRLIREVCEAARSESDRLLTPAEAAEVLGVRPDSVRRLQRQGKLANYGKPRSPLVRLGDLAPHLRVANSRPALQLPRSSRQQVARSPLRKGD